jgi:hypothetical protein
MARLLTTTDGTAGINDINLVTDYTSTKDASGAVTSTVTPGAYVFTPFTGPSDSITVIPSQTVDFMYFYEDDIISGAMGTLSTSLCLALATTVLF